MRSVWVTDRQARLVLDPAQVTELARFTLESEGSAADVEIAFVDDATIADLNRRFLGVEGPTDVITFPSGDETDRPSDSSLGEIVVSTDTAFRQASAHPEPPIGSDPVRECLLYVVHGLLHLFGYDDRTEEQARAMAGRQTEIIEAWSSRGEGDS